MSDLEDILEKAESFEDGAIYDCYHTQIGKYDGDSISDMFNNAVGKIDSDGDISDMNHNTIIWNEGTYRKDVYNRAVDIPDLRTPIPTHAVGGGSGGGESSVRESTVHAKQYYNPPPQKYTESKKEEYLPFIYVYIALIAVGSLCQLFFGWIPGKEVWHINYEPIIFVLNAVCFIALFLTLPYFLVFFAFDDYNDGLIVDIIVVILCIFNLSQIIIGLYYGLSIIAFPISFVTIAANFILLYGVKTLRHPVE